VSRWRKRPVEVDAIQWTGGNWDDVAEFMGSAMSGNEADIARQMAAADGRVRIRTLEGTMAASLGDWIIRGVQCELYPCKPDIFDATYESAEPEITR
jgi:hypothetical protein